ncbi:NAD(P)-binding protein [Mytilinidion resinicola]|uniref:NAD(P)-binding protein n=1 Tax=Mytilinidion resinicola TaxID=574789 RepID=A0A6A6Y4A2_9PEZI|nr:NAD(P)-binding protein [Mytilinidion resinicola]KAF2803459.1 NAD(P)-binding protein [Mytilinidion resinicola]
MASYVIAGASRGLGYQYLQTLNSNPSNTVIGLARNPSAVQSQLAADGIPNVHVLAGDLTSPASLSAAAAEVSKLTNSKVDYLIVNGAYVSDKTSGLTPTGFVGNEELLKADFETSINTNVVGVIYTINAFLGLVKASAIKKVVVISTGMTEPDLIKEAEVAASVTYSASKAATNVVVYKYAVELKSEGVIVLALSPGLVRTGLSEEMYEYLAEVFRKYEPGFKGAISTKESVEAQLKVIGAVTIEQSGEFLSHLGTKRWL